MPASVYYSFGPFTLEPASFRLSNGSSEVPLTPKAFELLALLVRLRHRALTKQELFDAVWPNTAVTENTLTQRIKEIREALGDRAQEPVYIRTLPRVGFQFVAEVVEGEVEKPAEPPRQADVLPGAPALPATADRPRPDVADTRPGRNRLALGAAAVAVVAAMAGLLYGIRPDGRGREAGKADRRVMLAILPFENLSGDPEQAYLSDGLTEEMIAELGRLDPTRLGVIARTSTMAYRSTTKTVAEIARELRVDFVLEGSVRREGDHVRIVAQLIRAADQSHVWAERYDRDLRSILAVQSEVAMAIARQTRATLSAGREELPVIDAGVHPDAYRAYLKGRYFLNRRTSDAIGAAVEQFQQALLIEPTYAQAHAGLADAHELMASYANARPHESLERAIAAAQRALELDPRLPDAYTSLGTIHASYTWKWDESERAFSRALSLNPSHALAHKGYAELLSYLGRHDEAIKESRQALDLDPLSPLMSANLGVTYYRARRYEEALQQMEQTLRLDPNYMLAHLNLGLIYAARGAYDDAAGAFQRASGQSPAFADARGLLGYAYAKAGRLSEARVIEAEVRGSVGRSMSAYVRGHYYMGLGDEEQALSELERAFGERSWLMALVKIDPLLDELRLHPRFQTLLRQMQFPQ